MLIKPKVKIISDIPLSIRMGRFPVILLLFQPLPKTMSPSFPTSQSTPAVAPAAWPTLGPQVGGLNANEMEIVGGLVPLN